MQLVNAVFCITMLVLYCSQIGHYALYLENIVREIVTLCKI